MALENKLFAKYGHECELTTIRDDLPMFRTGGNILTQIRNSFRRSIMAADDNINSLKYLKSQKNVEYERVQQASQYIFMIHPFSDYRRGWEAFMVMVFVIVFIVIPLDIASHNFPLKNSVCGFTGWKMMRMICDILLCVDIMMNFLTGYWDKRNSRVVMNPKKVAARYVCTYFLFDILSSIPTHLDLFSKKSAVKAVMAVIQNLSIFKFLRIVTFFRYCRQTCEAHNWNYLKYRLILAIFCYILYFHLLTCGHIVLVGKYTNKKKLVSGKHGNEIYLWTIFRSTIYLATFCYSSLTLSGYVPKYLYLIIWILSKLVNFFLISQFMEVAMSSCSSSRKYFEMLRELKEYMRHKQLPVSLQGRLLDYYEFKFQKSYFRESEILNILSGQLKQDLVMHSCRKLVEHVGFFQNLPLPLIVRIVSSLATEIFMVNDVIIKINTPGTCMYFIASGCVAVYTRNGYEVKHLEDGDYFGEYALLKGELRECSVVAVETCELYRLEKGDFIRVVMSYPDLIEKIQKHAVDRLEMTEFIEARFDRRRRVPHAKARQYVD